MKKSFNLSKKAQTQPQPLAQPITQGRIEADGITITREGTKIVIDGILIGQEAGKMPVVMNLLQNLFTQNPSAQKPASAKSLNLKTAQEKDYSVDDLSLGENPEKYEPMDQLEPMPLENDTLSPLGEQPAPAGIDEQPLADSNIKFIDGNEFRDYLNKNDYSNVRTQIIDVIPESYTKQDETGNETQHSQDEVKSRIENFYQIDIPEEKLTEADNIFKILPDTFSKIDESSVPAIYTKGSVKETESIIKLLASQTALARKTEKFNLTKTAQHKGFENVIMFGPEQMKVDPFLRQPVSNYALLERNKGFGLVVDDVWDIDYETIWRSTIMDKYSRPYRDKEGNWVGGYIQKRFEVDKNIPITNNMQLKPGQRMKPILPEYGSTEARLEAARMNEAKNKTASPYNLHFAENKKKSKLIQAEIKDLKPLNIHNEYLEGPKPEFETICTQCGSPGPNISDTKNLTSCPNCNGKLKVLDSVQRKVDEKGPQPNQFSTNNPSLVQKNAPLPIAANHKSSIKQSSLPVTKEDDDEEKRVKDEFVSEDFKQCPKKPNNYDDIVGEITKSCEDLAIDG